MGVIFSSCMTQETPSDPVALARRVVAGLWASGAREAVVCAGARNAALVAALNAARGWQLWSFPEERSAAFFALGRVAAGGRPVAVVTTSGTAAAELLPALIEAHYQGLPLLAVTADRPRAYRGSGAPQAIEQVGLFGPYVERPFDVATLAEVEEAIYALSQKPPQRPWHLNVCLEEPEPEALAALSTAEAGDSAPFGSTPTPPAGEEERLAAAQALGEFLAQPGPLLALASTLPPQEIEPAAAFLRRLGCPVWAEATSGLREHPALAAQQVRGGEGSVAAAPISRVLRLGGVPSCRWWRDVEKRPELAVCSLTGTGFSGLARPSFVLPFPVWDRVPLPDVPPAPPFATWPQEAARTERVEQALASHSLSEPAFVRALSEAIPPQALVFLGNSLPIREWNAFASWHPRGLRCRANRGANGIDGLVSTFLGWSVGETESWAVLGDLSALYDLAGPWITSALPPGRRRLVILNNGGGRIFRRAVALRGADTSTRTLMENPHALAFRHWAELWGWDYRLLTQPHELAEAARTVGPHAVLELVPDLAQTESFWAALA